MSASPDDFLARLRTSLNKAKAAAPASTDSAVATAPEPDTFSQRIQESLAKSSGGLAAPPGARDAFRDRLGSAMKAARGEAPASAATAGAAVAGAAGASGAPAARHVMAKNETLAQVAARSGVPVEQVWNAPENAALREQRQSPHVVQPGDVVALPATAAPAPAPAAQPVGQGDYVVRAGDCMSSIALEHGFYWATLWNDAPNAALKEARVNPNVLFVGDRVTIREKTRKDEPIAAEQRHTYVRRGEPSKFVLVLRAAGQPRANLPFKLIVDKYVFEGTTDAQGRLEAPIPGNARRGLLLLGPPERCEKYELDLGHLPPSSAVDGVQSRLNNLGFDAGPPSGRMTSRTVAALRAFQEKHALPVTGEVDDATRTKLEEVHGS